MQTQDRLIVECFIRKDDFVTMQIAFHEHLGAVKALRKWHLRVFTFLAVVTVSAFLITNFDHLGELSRYGFIVVLVIWQTGLFLSIMVNLKSSYAKQLRDAYSAAEFERIHGHRQYSLCSEAITVTVDAAKTVYNLRDVSAVRIITDSIIYIEHPWFGILIPPMAFEDRDGVNRFAELIRQRALAAGSQLDPSMPLEQKG